jgi:hypothetical protein
MSWLQIIVQILVWTFLVSGSKVKHRMITRVDTPTTTSRMVPTVKTSSLNVFRYDPTVLVEEPAIGTLIIDLSSKLGLNLDTSEFKFRFYSPSSVASHYFLIDQLTGQVKTQRSIDREYLCESKICGPCSTSNCTLTIEIVASAPSQLVSADGVLAKQIFMSFDVVIEDKNEFPPQFPKSELFLNLSEAAPVNFQIPLEPAIDRDSRQSMITYSIAPLVSSSKESLDQLNSKLKLITSPYSSQLSLVIMEPFDYELIHEYSFKLLATDNGSPPLTGVCLITLKIIDVNDNIPVFDRQEYEYRIDEGVKPGTRLIRVHATDKDEGLNSQVKYSFGEHIKADFLPIEYFVVEENSGWIVAKTFLDYEQINTFRFTVKAQDQGANSMPVYAAVTIYLNDLNDNAPMVNVTVDDDLFTFIHGQLSMSEWTHPGTFIAQVVVSDADSGANGQFRVELEQNTKCQNEVNQGNVFALEHLFNNIYSLLLKQPVDRETCDRYELVIKSTDFGNPPLSTTFAFEVNILDENDNRPEFVYKDSSDTFYEFKIAEGTVKSLNELVHIGKIEATDRDVGLNSKLIYELQSLNNTDWFKINKDTGDIYALSNQLDRELNEDFELEAVCKDSGEPQLESHTKIIVRLIDINDNAPVFTQHLYVFNVSEDLSKYMKFGQVSAHDADDPRTNNSKLKYEIRNQSSIHGIVNVNANTGELFLASNLDYETVKVYEFEVYACDFGLESLCSKTFVRISVVDVNDNAPQILWPTNQDLPLVRSLDLIFETADTDLFRVNATDLDSNENAKLDFLIEKQQKFLTSSFDSVATVNLFDCDRTTGLVKGLFVTNKRKPNAKLNAKRRENYSPTQLSGVYWLSIKVTDSSKLNQLETQQNLIVVLNSNASDLAETIDLLKRFFASDQRTNDKRLISLKNLYNEKSKASGILLSAKVNLHDGKSFADRLFEKTSKLLLVLIVFSSIMFLFIILSIFAIICYKKQKERLKKRNGDDLSKLDNKNTLTPLIAKTSSLKSSNDSTGDEQLTPINTNSPSSSLLSNNSTRPSLKESCISSNQTASTTSMCAPTVNNNRDSESKDEKLNTNLSTFKTQSPIQSRLQATSNEQVQSKYTTLPTSYKANDNFNHDASGRSSRNPSTRSNNKYTVSNSVNSSEIFCNIRAIDEKSELKYASSESADDSVADVTNETVPEYFFKDKKEYKTFLNKKNINCKHLVISGKRINTNNECFL